MAQVSAVDAHRRRNSKLDSFLKRNTERGVYESMRASEPCVVVCEAVHRAFMHVILSDDCVFLAEYPPRRVTALLRFSQIRDIRLVNDLPDFLSGKQRDRSQHILVLYSTAEPQGRRGRGARKGKKAGLPVRSLPSHRKLQLAVPRGLEGIHSWRISPEPQDRDLGAHHAGEDGSPRSASWPDPENPGLGGAAPLWPPPCSPHEGGAASTDRAVPRRPRCALQRLWRRGGVGGGAEVGAEREAELHLYSVSRTSLIYLHLQDAWSSFLIRSTLMLDPAYMRRCSASFHSCPGKHCSPLSGERRALLFSQLAGELTGAGLRVERLYLLLQELHAAAGRHAALRTLFWRSSDVCVFLVRTLEEALPLCQNPGAPPPGAPPPGAPPPGGHSTDQLLLCSLIVQTLAVMFRETELEPARHIMLTAKRGALTARMLRAAVCDPRLHHPPRDPSLQRQLQTLLAEYLDSACSLLFELILLGQEASRGSSLENFLTVGWLFGVLHSQPHLLPFMGYQAQQVVCVLGGPGPEVLSPVRSVLVYQRCRVLLAGAQHSPRLRLHLHAHYREEFRYYVTPSAAAERLPAHYPISRQARGLLRQLLALLRHQPLPVGTLNRSTSC